VRQRIIAVNPFSSLQQFRLPKAKIRTLSDEEIMRIVAACPDMRWQAMVVIAATGGLRPGEIVNLTINDVDLQRREITICPKAETRSTWRWEPKDHECRVVPLSELAATMCCKLMAELPEGQPYLFLPADVYRRRIEQMRQGELKDFIKRRPDQQFSQTAARIFGRAGVRGATFYDLRRTCLTNLANAGVSPYDVRMIAGHSKIDTTLGFYIKPSEARIDNARRVGQEHLELCAKQLILRTVDGIKESAGTLHKSLHPQNLETIGATGLEPATS